MLAVSRFQRGVTLNSSSESFLPVFIDTITILDGAGNERPPAEEIKKADEELFIPTKKDGAESLCDIVLRDALTDDIGGAVLQAVYYSANNNYSRLVQATTPIYLVTDARPEINTNNIPLIKQQATVTTLQSRPSLLTYSTTYGLLEPYSQHTNYSGYVSLEYEKSDYSPQPIYRVEEFTLSIPFFHLPFYYTQQIPEIIPQIGISYSLKYFRLTQIPNLEEARSQNTYLPRLDTTSRGYDPRRVEVLHNPKADNLRYSGTNPSYKSELPRAEIYSPQRELDILPRLPEPQVRLERAVSIFYLNPSENGIRNPVMPELKTENILTPETISLEARVETVPESFVEHYELTYQPFIQGTKPETRYNESRARYKLDRKVKSAHKELAKEEVKPVYHLRPPHSSENREETGIESKVKPEDNTHKPDNVTQLFQDRGPKKIYDTDKKRREDCSGVKPKSEELRDSSGKRIRYDETRKRADLCAVRPEVILQENGGMYKLILDENSQSGEARYIRVYNFGEVNTEVAKQNSVLAGIDSLLERTGLVAEYAKGEHGIYLLGIKGIQNAEYVISIIDGKGNKRYLKQSIDKETFDPTKERISVQYFNKVETHKTNSNPFNPMYFRDVVGLNYEKIDGVGELARFRVTYEEASNTSMATLIARDEKGKVRISEVSKNSHLYLAGKHLEENGFEVVYGSSEFLLKDGKLVKEPSIYIEDILDTSGRSVMRMNKDTGYMIETVDSLGQRAEALADDGISALSSAQATAKPWEVLSVVGMIQGVYDRRQTYKAYADMHLKKAV